MRRVDCDAVGAGVAEVFGGGEGVVPEKDATYDPQDVAHGDSEDDD